MSSIRLVFSKGRLLVVALAAALCASSAVAASWKEKVLYSFQGIPDGAVPVGAIVFDEAGNLYGATEWAGADNCPGTTQCGIVYQLQPPIQKGQAWTENILYTFQGKNANDGGGPQGGLLIDSSGNLYGTTAYGGKGNCTLLGTNVGCGTVFKLSPPQQKGGTWSEHVIYSFQGDKDGYAPHGDLGSDSTGNLYGATQFGGGGGGFSCDGFYPYCGTVFELSPPKQKSGKWTEKVLYAFQNKKDGALPNGSLTLGKRGQLYGTTYCGGDAGCKNLGGGDGVIFRLNPSAKEYGAWTYRVIHGFRGGSKDGGGPRDGVIFDDHGNLYGTTVGGGGNHRGVLFELKPPMNRSGNWRIVILHSFSFGSDGVSPETRPTFDSSGNLYGTALGGKSGDGVVYQLTPSKGTKWTFALLYNFLGAPDGYSPEARIVLDDAGHAFSTTAYGGTGSQGSGTAFQVWP